MAGILHEEYLKQLFDAKADHKRDVEQRLARLPVEKKLEIWMRCQRVVREVLEATDRDESNTL